MQEKKDQNEILSDFIIFCKEMDFGMLEKVEIANGIPVKVYKATKTVRFDIKKNT